MLCVPWTYIDMYHQVDNVRLVKTDLDPTSIARPVMANPILVMLGGVDTWHHEWMQDAVHSVLVADVQIKGRRIWIR